MPLAHLLGGGISLLFSRATHSLSVVHVMIAVDVDWSWALT